MEEIKKEEGEGEKVDLSIITKTILKYITSDKFAIVLFLIALLACAYTVLTVEDYKAKINNHWAKQFKELNCVCSTVPINFNDTPMLPLVNMNIPNILIENG